MAKPEPMRALTSRQRQCLELIRERAASGTRPPTLHDICKRLQFRSTHYAWQLVQALAAKGYVQRNGFSHTGLTLLPREAESRFFFVMPEVCGSCGATYFGPRCPACAGVFQEKAS